MRVTIPDQAIADVLITALEGAVNYWGHVEHAAEFRRAWMAKESADVLLRKAAAIEIYEDDFDDDHAPPTTTLAGKLTMGNLQRGVNLMIGFAPHQVPGLCRGDGDVECADLFIQYAVFGECRYN